MTGRVEKLAGKGMIAFEVDGVLGRLSKGHSADPNLKRKMARITNVRAGAIIAARVKRRMRDSGKFADGRQWRPASGKPLLVSAKYAELGGFGNKAKSARQRIMRDTSGQVRRMRLRHAGFRDLQAMYAAAGNKGAFDVTGGMWKGLTVRPWGTFGIRMVFDGTSQGRGQWQKAGETLARDPIWSRKKKSVRNWMKAGAVFLGTGQNIIEVSLDETLAVASAVANTAAHAIAEGRNGKSVPVAVQYTFEGDRQLGRLLQQVLQR